jgi:methionyl-tRNA formyltransferase
VVVPAEEEQARPIAQISPPPSSSELPLLTPYIEEDTVHLAWTHGLPVFTVGDLAEETVQTLAGLEPDVAYVACFPWRIPPALLAAPAEGFLNLHPSLLPDYRGPHPMFWTFRDGRQQTGVTLHQMEESLDTGPIALQAPLHLDDGISGTEADWRAGQIGGELLLLASERLEEGSLSLRPQPAGGSYYPPPTAADFRLEPSWPAQRAFNFMRGTAGWGQPYPVTIAGRKFRLDQALACYPRQQLAPPYEESGREVWLQFAPGVLHARLA